VGAVVFLLLLTIDQPVQKELRMVRFGQILLDLGKIETKFWAKAIVLDLGKIKILHLQKHPISYGYVTN